MEKINDNKECKVKVRFKIAELFDCANVLVLGRILK